MKDKPNQKLALATFIKLMRATNSVSGRVHQPLLEENLTHSQFGVLEALYHLGPLCAGELGEKILKSNANLTTVIDSLERKELVKRVRSREDRRRVDIELTEVGHELIARVFPLHAEQIAREFDVLTREEQQELGRLLKKLGTVSSKAF